MDWISEFEKSNSIASSVWVGQVFQNIDGSSFDFTLVQGSQEWLD